MLEGEVLGYHDGAAYVKSDRMSDLKVMSMVSRCWPHEVPARALRMFKRGEAREMMELMCDEKVK